MKKIRIELLKFANARGLDKTFCPSEVAGHLFPDNWAEKMDDVRKAADTLVQENQMVVMQKGEVKNELPSQLKGPIRLRLRE